MRTRMLTVISPLLLFTLLLPLLATQPGSAQDVATSSMPEAVRQKFNHYVGNWTVEDRIADEVVATGRISLNPLPHGEGFEYCYVGGDWMAGKQIHSIGIIGWDASKQKLVEFNIDSSGSTFSSEFEDDGQGGYSAPISGSALNRSNRVVPFKGERTLANSGDQFVVTSKITFSGEEPLQLNSTFTKISDEEAVKAVTKDFQIYDRYFNGVWDAERIQGGETTEGIVTISTSPTGNAHLLTAEFENGDAFFDLWTYNQREGRWGGVFNNQFGHGGSSLLQPLSVDKIEAGFKTQSIGVGFGGAKVSSFTSKWNVVSDDLYTIESSDRLGNFPDRKLTLRRRTPMGKTQGDLVFKNYTALVGYDHWTTTQEGQEIDHAYSEAIPGKFVTLRATGGPIPFVATTGVDPDTGHCTWWFFNADYGLGKSIMTQISDVQWKLTQIEGRIRYEGLTTRVDENTIQQKVIKYTVDGEAVVPPGSVFTWKRQH